MKKIMTVISVLFVSLTVFAKDMERVSVETNSVAKKIFLGLPEVHQEMAKLSQEPAGPYHLVYITSKEWYLHPKRNPRDGYFYPP